MGSPYPNPSAATEWLTELKYCWTELAQLADLELLPEPQVNAFASRISKVTTHFATDLSTVVLLGLKMKLQTAAELLLDFVLQSPAAPLQEKLDVLQLLERFVDKQFAAYIRDKRIRGKNLRAHRKRFENSHMEAALLSRICENDIFDLEPRPLFDADNMDRFYNIANGSEKIYFVERMVGDKPQFVDVVFANYFAAKWFSTHFTMNRTFLANRLYSARRTVMRYLFDRILARNCDLHVAVLHDDVASVRRLLEDQGWSQRDKAGRTALHLAATRRTSRQAFDANCEILDLLLDCTEDAEVKDKLFAASPLLYADMSSAWLAIDMLLSVDANTRYLPFTSANLTSAAMLDAIYDHDLDKLLTYCLDNGLSVEHQLQGRHRMLTWACLGGTLRVATLLIARGADINWVHGDCYSPLTAASASGSLDIASLLIQKAKLAASPEESQQAVAYVNDCTPRTTALHVAAQNNNVEMADLLIREGADVWVRDGNQNTPLPDAFLWKNSIERYYNVVDAKATDVLATLLAAVDPARLAEYVNDAGQFGEMAMHCAAEMGDVTDARALVEAGASVTPCSDKGYTPLMIAAGLGRLEFVKFITDTVDDELKHDCINVQGALGKTALHCAALEGCHEVVQLLIEQGADLSVRDYYGATPLDYIDADPGEQLPEEKN